MKVFPSSIALYTILKKLFNEVPDLVAMWMSTGTTYVTSFVGLMSSSNVGKAFFLFSFLLASSPNVLNEEDDEDDDNDNGDRY